MMKNPRPAVGSWLMPRIALLALSPLLSCSDRTISEPSSPGQSVATRATGVKPVFVVEPTPLTVPTYDGSGQSVHPDVVSFDTPWNGHRFWLTMTPYAGSSQTLENPSILASDDGRALRVPAGLENPVIRAPRRARDYNSDPELLYEAKANRLVLFHRFVDARANTVHVSTSTDGVTWTRRPAPFWERTHRAVSPTVAPRPAAAARMWYVDAGKDGCETTATTRVMMRTATDASGGIVDTRWTNKVATDISIPGYQIWHIKARWIPAKSEYWMLIAAFPQDGNGCHTDDLFFARSTDGAHWTTYSVPVLRHEDREWTASAVYRSSFLYDAATDELSLWISAQGSQGAWNLGYARLRYASLLRALETNQPVAPAQLVTYRPTIRLHGQQP